MGDSVGLPIFIQRHYQVTLTLPKYFVEYTYIYIYKGKI